MLRLAQDQPVPFHVVRQTFPFADARRVDRHERFTVELEPHIDAVPRRARNFADDHPFRLGELVDERAFADVAAADDRQLQLRFRFLRIPRLRFADLRRRQDVHNRFQQLVLVAVPLHAGRDQRAVGEAVEDGDFIIQLRRIALVDDDQLWFLDPSQALRNPLIQRRHARRAFHDEHDHVGFVEGDLDLAVDVLGEIVPIHDADAAGIDQFEEPVADVHEIRDAIPCDAGHGVDDRDAFVSEPIQQRTLADVRPADNRHAGNGHAAPLMVWDVHSTRWALSTLTLSGNPSDPRCTTHFACFGRWGTTRAGDALGGCVRSGVGIGDF